MDIVSSPNPQLDLINPNGTIGSGLLLPIDDQPSLESKSIIDICLEAGTNNYKSVLETAQRRIESRLVELAEKGVYGNVTESDKTHRGGKALNQPLNYCYQTIFSFTDHRYTYKGSDRWLIVTLEGQRIGKRRRQLNLRTNMAEYELALQLTSPPAVREELTVLKRNWDTIKTVQKEIEKTADRIRALVAIAE